MNTTVFPFILRGVSLLGIDSVQMPHAERERIWNRIATDFPKKYFEVMGTETVGLADLERLSADILKGEVFGRHRAAHDDETIERRNVSVSRETYLPLD